MYEFSLSTNDTLTEPNTVLLGWPRGWWREGRAREAELLLEMVNECKAAEKAALLCVNLHDFPDSKQRLKGHIDIWWIVHDGGLLILLAFMLKQHKTWRRCKLNVYTVAEALENPIAVQNNLEQLLRQVKPYLSAD